MKYINGGIETPRDFISENVLPLFTHYSDAKPGLGYWIVSLVENPEPIGWCCLRETPDSPKLGTIGYRFLPHSWRNGYATESSQMLLQYGFSKHEFSSIRATTYEENTASRKTLEKLGFSLFRKFRLELVEQETAYFDSTDPWPGWDLTLNPLL